MNTSHVKPVCKVNFAVVATAPVPSGPDEWTGLDIAGRIGSYTIWNVDQVGDPLIFYERQGALFNDAGFAYLPSGPFAELSTGWFEAPRFRHLGGPWHSFVASW